MSEVRMNRRELVLALSERLDVDRRAADTALTTVVELITENVAKGEAVSIPGFAKFARRDLPARTVRNNFTGEMVKRPASKKVRITPLKAFKEAAISGRVAKKAAAKKAGATRATGTRATATMSRSAPTKKAAAKATARKATPAKKAPVKATATRTTRTAATRPTAKAPARKAAPRKVAARAATVKKAAAVKKAPARRTTARAR
jgi:DNA-binding protein HU-beta